MKMTLFIVEGLLMYVPPPAVDELLSSVVNASGPGSAFVADYLTTLVIEGTTPLKEAQVLRNLFKAKGFLCDLESRKERSRN